ncbi:hypothetical protein Tsubulata_022222 [Turnera subulata]|uniref:Uncharacterized protein n=1 Tax=Turnera subulata TaxID=218843 RepID=A0A9Q0FQZ0_9ROSI|nr:hypothetical protein Tsubulata_022222 [Turnera subulata]
MLEKGEELSDDLMASLNSGAANPCVDACEKILCAQGVHRTSSRIDDVPLQDENCHKLMWTDVLKLENKILEDEMKKRVRTQGREMRSCQKVCILKKMLNKDDRTSSKDDSINDARICGNTCARMLYTPMAPSLPFILKHYFE